jgi:hypothetical protein
MTEAEQLKESIELTDFLSTEQIRKILSMAIKHGPEGYEARLDIQLLMDELRARGLSVTNRFEVKGNDAIPRGTYEFLYENDLGAPNGTCENYGCGHPIRYEEHIKHIESGREFVVGNVCVERILGEHDLIRVATSLLARMSGKVERLNRAARCKAICGDVLKEVIKLDPTGRFSRPERVFLEAIESGKSGPTLKMAEELKAKWTPEAISRLKIDVAEWTHRSHPDANTDGWMTFLTYKKQTRPQSRDFWDNCVEAVNRNGVPTAGQQSALHDEFERFWKMARGDETVLEPLQGVFKYFGLKMLRHTAKCGSYFHIGLLEQLLEGRDMSWKQIEALNQGCRMCGWKLD